MEEKTQQRTKLILTFVILAVIAVILFAVWQMLSHRGKVRIDVKRVPGNVVIFVNDTESKSLPLYLPAGNYTIRGELNGYQSYSYELSISNDLPAQDPLFFLLTPVSDEAKQWAKDHQNEYLELETEVGELEAKKGDELRMRYPIITRLPYRGTLYNIDYSLGEGEEFRVQITSPNALGRQVAIETIKDWGYEPSDYIVEFLGFDNPFAE